MRSGTSFFDGALYKKSVTRWWPIWASYLVIWCFILPVNLLVDYAGSAMAYVIMDSLTAVLVLSVIFSLFAAMAVLSHLYSARSANFFASLPIRREGQFITLYLAGLCFLFVPDLIAAGLTGAVMAAAGTFDASVLLAWLAVAFGEGFFFYSFAFLCGMFAGHILALPVFYGVFNCLVLVISQLVKELASLFYWGFAGFSNLVNGFVRCLTPVWLLSWVRYRGPYNGYYGDVHVAKNDHGFAWKYLEYFWVVAVYAIAAAALTVCAFFLFKRRRTESAGDIVAVNAVKPVFKYGVAVCAGLTLGYVTSNILGEGTLPFTTVIWAVIGYFAAQMILDKSFRVFKKWPGAVATAAVLAAVFVVMIFDLTGFETRVPDIEDVESIEILSFYSSYGLGDTADWSDFTLTDKGEIAEFMELHRAAIDQREGRESYKGGVNLSITYHTKSGDIKRSYYVYVDPDGSDAATTALRSIFADRELWRRIYRLDKLESDLAAGGRIVSLTYYYYSWGDKTGDDPEREYDYFRDGRDFLNILNAGDIRAIYTALMEDFETGAVGRREMSAGDETRSGRRTIEISWYGPDGEFSDNIEITLTPDCETYRVLLELLPKVLEEQGLL